MISIALQDMTVGKLHVLVWSCYCSPLVLLSWCHDVKDLLFKVNYWVSLSHPYEPLRVGILIRSQNETESASN